MHIHQTLMSVYYTTMKQSNHSISTTFIYIFNINVPLTDFISQYLFYSECLYYTSQRFIVRLMQNLVLGSIVTFRHRSHDQNTKFRKLKVSDGRHFENGFIAISQLRIIRFQ